MPGESEHGKIGRAMRTGITGPVGAGKSTLISVMTRRFRSLDKTVGILAVDPSSPFTGGAVLGDRVRMTDLSRDEGVFIRSIATHGAFGGLAESVGDAADLLDMYGFDIIIIETVGVGQTEVDIVGACDVTVVVLEPSSGDSVQTIKAGLMEIADLFVVNKMDLKGGQRFVSDLEAAMHMKPVDQHVPVMPVLARTGEGVDLLCDRLIEQFGTLISGGKLAEQRARQRLQRIRRLAESTVMRRLWENVPDDYLQTAANSSTPVRGAAMEIAERIILKSTSIDNDKTPQRPGREKGVLTK